MKHFLRLVGYVRPYWHLFLVSAITAGGVGLFNFLYLRLIQPTFDQLLPSNADVVSEQLRTIPFLIVAFFLGKGICHYVSKYSMSQVGHSVVRDFRNELFRSVTHQSLGFLSERPTGSLLSRIMNDVEKIRDAVAERLSVFLSQTAVVAACLSTLFVIDWKLASISLVLGPLAIYPMIKFGRRLRKVSRVSQETKADLSEMLVETLGGARVVRAFGMEEAESSRFEENTNKLRRADLKAAKIDAIMAPLMEVVGSFCAAAIIVYGASQIASGRMTTGSFVTFNAALFFLYDPIKKISRANVAIQQAIPAARRVFSVLDASNEVKDPVDGLELRGLSDAIEFEGVKFAYGDEVVLEELSLRVTVGEAVAIVGPSGSGKTSLVNLLPRFFDVSGGRLLIDGEDVRRFRLASLRSNIAIVTQETFLFNTSVRNNIAYGNPRATDEDVMRAAEAAYAREFVEKLPDGFETILGERGHRLSGGERQRIAIARALLKDAPILILDEATSALDSESETLVQSALMNLMEGRTTFVVAHRFSTVRTADRIVVLEQGNIIETGTHEGLYAQDGVYRRLCELQLVGTQQSKESS